MAINCGIVGLPNVGKSTIFSALTATAAEAANYPFCTIQPNKGIVPIADERLARIAAIIPAEQTVYATMEFVDIAGLVRGASNGEGLGNQFLANIRETNLIVHVTRCFEDSDIVHVEGGINPLRDIETIATELALADLATIAKAKQRYEKWSKAAQTDKAGRQRTTCALALELLDQLETQLGQLQSARKWLAQHPISAEQLAILQDLHLLTAKPQIYVCNVSEGDLAAANSLHAQGNGRTANGQTNNFAQAVHQLAAAEGAQALSICGQLEADIAAIEGPEERKLFLQELGLREQGLQQLARLAYSSLGLGSFFTVGGKENRAWTFSIGETAPQCAGKIHSDFEKGFIKAEVFHCQDLFAINSQSTAANKANGGPEAQLKSAGKLRLEGKTYPVQDGDVLHFKFNH